MAIDSTSRDRRAVALLRQALPGLTAAWLFGSAASGDEHAGSDLDLAILAAAPLDAVRRHDVQEDLVSALGRPVDRVIDAAMHLVRVHRLGVPQETREAFDLLERAGRLDPDLASRLRRMAGFPNVAVHDYQKLNLQIVRSIIVERLDDFLEFTRVLLRE